MRSGMKAPLVALLASLLAFAGPKLRAADPAGTGACADPAGAAAAQAPAPASRWPMLLGAQYTFIEQWQSDLTSPYEGRLSLHPDGDRQGTHTIGFYSGWAPLCWAQLYFDTEKFMGAGVSGAAGLGGLTNGDVIREGVSGLKKQFYVARAYVRFMLPLAGFGLTTLGRGQDQLPGTEADRRLELKAGQMAVTDDFDRNRYAGSARTEFLNWSLWNNTAFDYAANTRGYTDGVMAAYISPAWSLRYGIYRMPLFANGQTMETLNRANEQDLELTLSPPSLGTVVRLLAFRNQARMGDYAQALAIAAAAGTLPDVAADDENGRHKRGYGLNLEQPVADGGDSGVFMRLGWNDGHTEDFAFTEVDRLASAGGQLSGVHWQRPDDRLGVGLAIEGLSDIHREYLAAGGCGFLLCDGRLDYTPEHLLETYYRAQWTWVHGAIAVRVQLSPDFQYIENPGFNQDRGPVRFYALRLHLEY
jgi:high affinity Mn2+ porin